MVVVVVAWRCGAVQCVRTRLPVCMCVCVRARACVFVWDVERCGCTMRLKRRCCDGKEEGESIMDLAFASVTNFQLPPEPHAIRGF